MSIHALSIIEEISDFTKELMRSISKNSNSYDDCNSFDIFKLNVFALIFSFSDGGKGTPNFTCYVHTLDAYLGSKKIRLSYYTQNFLMLTST